MFHSTEEIFIQIQDISLKNQEITKIINSLKHKFMKITCDTLKCFTQRKNFPCKFKVFLSKEEVTQIFNSFKDQKYEHNFINFENVSLKNNTNKRTRCFTQKEKSFKSWLSQKQSCGHNFIMNSRWFTRNREHIVSKKTQFHIKSKCFTRNLSNLQVM